uniref:N/A n=1 Tax=Ganoderma boninense TaxID=34458 RepID=A0A5K1JX46_9APHY|nr:N/A [Ganoderma boninense]
MKTIKNLFTVPPLSPTRGSRLSCLQCKKSFKPSDQDQVYCSINCSRMESWLAMNRKHVAKQRALGLLPDSNAGASDTKRLFLAPLRFSPSDKLATARPSTAPPWRVEFPRPPPSNRDGHGTPRRVLRKRSVSTSCASSSRTLCSLPPPLPPSPSRSSFQRVSRRISQTPSQASTVVADPFYQPGPSEHDAYTRLVGQNRSSVTLAHPPRPRLTSSVTAPTPSATPRTPKTPFLTRTPNPAIMSHAAARPSTFPGPLKKSITGALGTPPAEGAPPTPGPPPESGPPARLRAGFDRRAARPRSNSFGGFGSLAIHAT